LGSGGTYRIDTRGSVLASDSDGGCHTAYSTHRMLCRAGASGGKLLSASADAARNLEQTPPGSSSCRRNIARKAFQRCESIRKLLPLVPLGVERHCPSGFKPP